MDDRARPPAVEPEIIPPERPGAPHGDRRSHAWFSIRTREHSYDYAATPGPLALVLALLALGGLALVVLLILLGTFLILVPVLVVSVGLLILSAIFGRNFRRIRRP